ncbi:serine/threonine protein kinase [Cystobacter fuscus]|uniref:serine/threonine protein kinase n=1 Tax=Cystobacter fuscus TaxID=43 RepID=UPI002B30D9A1|nr:serine/threonine protein kinase [Cystobacter fuscus]
MTTHALHPDQLKPGDMVGPWLITQVLGRGGSSRVFKVERDGQPYSMKVALRPLSDSRAHLFEDKYPEEEYVEEKNTYRRLAREAAALFTYSSHPNLLRVYGVDFWPSPSTGYPFLVTDYVDGDTWHEWRWRTPPHALRLVRAFSDVVRTVGALHARGVYHRDLKAENVLIRRTDGRPFLIDFGTARLPGALTQTMGLPEGVLHLVPPELLAYARSQAWEKGKPFRGGASADLYALGVLLYQALTDLHPFNPELPDKELVAAIATVPPMAPHLLNPLAPRSLSDIAMKLLEKRPEDRYPSTEALLQALEVAAEKGSISPAWKVPIFPAEEGLEEAEEDLEEPPQEEEEREPSPRWPEPEPEGPQEVQPLVEEREPQPQAASAAQGAPPPSPEELARQEPPAAAAPPRRAWRSRLLFGMVGLSVLGLALGLVLATLAPPSAALPPGPGHSMKGIPTMSTAPRSASSSLLAAWLCATAGLGCPAVQVKPPEPADCPQEATEAMSEALKLRTASPLEAIIDINQPGEAGEAGVYQDGPIISRITQGDGNLPEGTLLHGQLWTGPGIDEEWGERRRPAVMGRYTQAVLPDGRKFPVCIVLGDRDGRIPMADDSKPSAFLLSRNVPVSAVWRWP